MRQRCSDAALAPCVARVCLHAQIGRGRWGHTYCGLIPRPHSLLMLPLGEKPPGELLCMFVGRGFWCQSLSRGHFLAHRTHLGMS